MPRLLFSPVQGVRPVQIREHKARVRSRFHNVPVEKPWYRSKISARYGLAPAARMADSLLKRPMDAVALGFQKIPDWYCWNSPPFPRDFVVPDDETTPSGEIPDAEVGPVRAPLRSTCASRLTLTKFTARTYRLGLLRSGPLASGAATDEAARFLLGGPLAGPIFRTLVARARPGRRRRQPEGHGSSTWSRILAGVGNCRRSRICRWRQLSRVVWMTRAEGLVRSTMKSVDAEDARSMLSLR